MPSDKPDGRPLHERLASQSAVKSLIALVRAQVVVSRIFEFERNVPDITSIEDYGYHAVILGFLVQNLTKQATFPRRALPHSGHFVPRETPRVRLGAHNDAEVTLLKLTMHPRRPSLWRRNLVRINLAADTVRTQALCET
jgi:hypothetical protein